MLDVEAGTIDLLVSKRAQGTPVVAVGELDWSLGGDAIVATEDIRSLHDLVGKEIAFARDDVGETLLACLFHKAGLSLDQITIVPKAPDRAAGAFLRGEAQAVVTWEPWVTRALARAGAHVLVTSKDEPGIIVDVLNVREDLVREKSQVVRGLLRGWYKALEDYRADPSGASQIIAPHFDLTPEDYRKQVTGLRWPTYEEALHDFEDADGPGRLSELFDTIALVKHSNGRIPSKPDAGPSLKPEILRDLYGTKEPTE